MCACAQCTYTKENLERKATECQIYKATMIERQQTTLNFSNRIKIFVAKEYTTWWASEQATSLLLHLIILSCCVFLLSIYLQHNLCFLHCHFFLSSLNGKLHSGPRSHTLLTFTYELEVFSSVSHSLSLSVTFSCNFNQMNLRESLM